MYSNDTNQIKMGFTNYIGALLKASKQEAPASQRDVVAILVEEALKLSQDENKVVGLYQVKPLINGVIFILKQRCKELEKLPKKNPIIEQIEKYNEVINILQDMIKNIN